MSLVARINRKRCDKFASRNGNDLFIHSNIRILPKNKKSDLRAPIFCMQMSVTLGGLDNAMADDKANSGRAGFAYLDILKESLGTKELLELLIEVSESVSEALAVYDSDGRLVICNQNFRDLYGYSKAETRPGTHFRELGKIDLERGNVAIGDEYGDGEAYLKRKADYRASLEGFFIVRMKDGRWIKTTDRRLPRGGFVSVQSDITNEKQAEFDLRVAKETAEIANRAKSEFLANMSHELRTPLNSIIGFSHAMTDKLFGELGDPKYSEYAEDIRASAQHLLSVVSDILDLTKIEAGRFSISEDNVDLTELADYTARILNPRAKSKKIDLCLDVSPDVSELRADIRLLRQIFINLVDNAIKFTPNEGHVGISCRRDSSGDALVTIKDTGLGMAPNEIAIALEPFLQLRRSADVAFEGTGLGLPLAKKMVELHGGVLTIESEEGAGTTVTLRFPSERVIQPAD